MKKLGLIMMLSIVLIISACTSNNGGNPQGESTGENSGETKNGKKTVVLSVMTNNRFFESAVRKFEDIHPDIHIEIKEYKASTDDGGGGMSMQSLSLADIEKYVQSVTTQVLSGKGPDLILMSELPQDKFVAKKLLVDLNDLFGKDSSIDRNALYTNILEASKDGDGLYAVPLSFSLDLFSGNTEILKKANLSIDNNKSWSWNEFRDVMKKLKESNPEIDSNLDPMSLLMDYMEDKYVELVGQGNPNFDSDMFRNMLKEIKLMYDEGIIAKEMSFGGSNSAFQMSGIYGLEQALTMRKGVDYYQKPSAAGDKKGAPFRASYSLGINSKSEVQQEAWEFISFLLSDEMQEDPNLMGVPINKAITEKKLQEILQKLENGTLETMISKEMLPDVETAKKRIEVIKRMLPESDFRRFSDMKVLTIAMEEFSSFISGQKSAEEVSKLIQNRVKTYLNE
ncbi:ABC transporter substrate-binding protein [Cohnella abietis]|uniref:ABC transporter substrate-binding protein n=1 Tax=Cohnella abietis TaxID=2507935 RepID=A0A3T1D3F1_9BACL|nr:ABC transporter substrate-binding protein [Cohnella abietis]BBI32642.1 ABC transporter substrate-binding protein [Cohnella abietis]